MRKILVCCCVALLVSCGKKKEVQLAKSDVSVVSEMEDHSPIYLFFDTKAKDTVVDLNRKNAIGTTNWIFHVDRRLPMHAVTPQLIFMQNRKKNGMHVNDKAGNFFSYNDTLQHKLAFYPFTETRYELKKKSDSGNMAVFQKNNAIAFRGKLYPITELSSLVAMLGGKPLVLGYDAQMNFGQYLQTKLFLHKLNLREMGLPIEDRLDVIVE